MSSLPTSIQLGFHPAQQEVLKSPHRFNVLVAGRRFGKTDFAIKRSLIEGLRTEMNGRDLTDFPVWIVGPTFLQEKRIAWNRLKRLCAPVTEAKYENEGRIVLTNGRSIEIKGADDPDSLHGVGLSHVTLDEYAGMKPMVWDVAIRPMLADVKGTALFIGTLKGKNHFWGLAQEAKLLTDWGYYEYASTENPFLDSDEINYARQNMTKEAFREQFLNKPATGGGKLLKSEWVQFGEEPVDAVWCITVDLAGFIDEEEDQSKYKQLDNSAIAIAKITPDGRWFVKEIRYGRWGVRETATFILKACQDYGVRDPGIEKGALKNAVMPYLKDQMLKIGYFIEPIPLVHGGQHKTDRIVWALAGRMEHGRATFPHNAGPWLDKMMDEMADFPNPRAQDDLLDSLAYIDQVAQLTGSGFEVGSYAGNLIDDERI